MRESSSPIPSNRGLRAGFYSPMTVRAQIRRIFEQEDINFLLTNRIPRRLVTQFHRLVQPDRTAAHPRSIDCDMASVFRSRPDRGEESAILQSTRLFHPRTQGRHASRRQQARRPDQPVRRHCRGLWRRRRHQALSGQGVSLHVAGSALRSGARRGSSQRRLRHVATNFEHVSSFPCPT